MPYYRGVEKDALIDSVERARAFLGKLDMGPGAKRAVDVMLGPERTGMIELADTNQELHYAVNEVNLGMVIGMLARVLKFHVLNDPSPGPGQNSEAREVYAGLAAWGAFMPEQFKVMSSIDKEFDAYLLPAYAKSVTDEDEEADSDGQRRLKEFLEDAGRKLASEEGSEKITKWLDESISLVIGLSKIDATDEVQQVLQGNPAGAALIPAAFEAMLNLDERIKDMKIANPIGTYEISLGAMPPDDDEQKNIYGPILEQMQDLMLSFVQRDEMLSTMIVFANPRSGEGCIRIFGTREAMEYLAEHLPEDMPLYDPEGRKIVPPSDRGPPQRGSSPGPSPF